jgi:hypothetical protein
VSTTLEQRDHLSFDSANGSDIERTLTENAYLVHICQRHLSKRRKVIVLEPPQHVRGSKALLFIMGHRGIIAAVRSLWIDYEKAIYRHLFLIGL